MKEFQVLEEIPKDPSSSWVNHLRLLLNKFEDPSVKGVRFEKEDLEGLLKEIEQL